MAIINAIPPILDLNIYAGDDVGITLTVTDDTGAPYNLTGTLLAQIRKGHGQPVVEVLSSTAMAPTTGVCYLSLTADQTEALGEDGGRHSWDLQLTNGTGIVATLCRGGITTQLDITDEALL